MELEFSDAKTQDQWNSEILNVIRMFKDRNSMQSPAESFIYYDLKSPSKKGLNPSQFGRTALGNLISPGIKSPKIASLISPGKLSIGSESRRSSISSFGALTPTVRMLLDHVMTNYLAYLAIVYCATASVSKKKLE